MRKCAVGFFTMPTVIFARPRPAGLGLSLPAGISSCCLCKLRAWRTGFVCRIRNYWKKCGSCGRTANVLAGPTPCSKLLAISGGHGRYGNLGGSRLFDALSIQVTDGLLAIGVAQLVAVTFKKGKYEISCPYDSRND